jgi:hypothetical protein
VLKGLVGIFEFETIGQGKQIPALMKERPKVRTVAPSDFLQDLLIDFKGNGIRRGEIEGKILMKEEACKIGVFGL